MPGQAVVGDDGVDDARLDEEQRRLAAGRLDGLAAGPLEDPTEQARARTTRRRTRGRTGAGASSSGAGRRRGRVDRGRARRRPTRRPPPPPSHRELDAARPQVGRAAPAATVPARAGARRHRPPTDAAIRQAIRRASGQPRASIACRRAPPPRLAHRGRVAVRLGQVGRQVDLDLDAGQRVGGELEHRRGARARARSGGPTAGGCARAPAGSTPSGRCGRPRPAAAARRSAGRPGRARRRRASRRRRGSRRAGWRCRGRPVGEEAERVHPRARARARRRGGRRLGRRRRRRVGRWSVAATAAVSASSSGRGGPSYAATPAGAGPGVRSAACSPRADRTVTSTSSAPPGRRSASSAARSSGVPGRGARRRSRSAPPSTAPACPADAPDRRGPHGPGAPGAAPARRPRARRCCGPGLAGHDPRHDDQPRLRLGPQVDHARRGRASGPATATCTSPAAWSR